MPLSVSFLETQELRWLVCVCGGGGRGCGLIRRRLSPDVCSFCVSRNAPVSVTQRGLIVACQDSPITFFSFKILGFSHTEEVEYRNAHLLH